MPDSIYFRVWLAVCLLVHTPKIGQKLCLQTILNIPALFKWTTLFHLCACCYICSKSVKSCACKLFQIHRILRSILRYFCPHLFGFFEQMVCLYGARGFRKAGHNCFLDSCSHSQGGVHLSVCFLRYLSHIGLPINLLAYGTSALSWFPAIP